MKKLNKILSKFNGMIEDLDKIVDKCGKDIESNQEVFTLAKSIYEEEQSRLGQAKIKAELVSANVRKLIGEVL